MGEKEQGLKDLKEAIKLKITNPIPWHFMALYYKEEKNYEQAMKNYTMALKNDKENFNVYREQSYLQLYLRLYESFYKTAKKCIELKPNLVANWVTYSFACYLQKNYAFAEKIIDSAINLTTQNENNKPAEIFELKLFKTKLKIAQEQYADAIEYLKLNEKDILDKTCYNEFLSNLNFKIGKYTESLEHNALLLKVNSDNMEYLISRLRTLLLVDNKINTETNLISFVDLLELGQKQPEILTSCRQYLKEFLNQNSDDKVILKSNVVQRVNLACMDEKEFEIEIKKYFKSQIDSTNPAVIISIEWIYDYQPLKATVLDNVLNQLNEELSKNGTVFGSDLVPIVAWFNFTISLHKKQIKDYEAALNHINKAIDTTPSVIEFFTTKSIILKKVFQFKESEMAYSKAKKLDVGDRFLNAKHAKASIRAGNYKDGEKVMHEFVKGTIDDESLEHTQTTWYITEVAFSNLRNGEYAMADRLLNSLISIFNSIYDDQFDFFNYCLRRNMVNHLIESMEYMDRVFDHSHLYKGFEAMDNLYEFCSNILKNEEECKKLEKIQLAYNETDFKDTKYKFDSFKKIKENIENKVLDVIQRLQPYAKDEHFHYFAVKFSLINNKPLLAYKSLNFFKLKNSTSPYYLLAKDLVAKYVISKQENTPFNNILVEILPEFSSPNEILNKNKKIFDDEFSKLKRNEQLKEKEFKKNISLLLPFAFYLNDKSSIERVLEGVLEKDLQVVSQVSYKNYSKLLTFARLYFGEDYMNSWNLKFREKFSSYNHPSKTIYNLDLYDIYNEDKKPKFDQ